MNTMKLYVIRGIFHSITRKSLDNYLTSCHRKNSGLASFSVVLIVLGKVKLGAIYRGMHNGFSVF